MIKQPESMYTRAWGFNQRTLNYRWNLTMIMIKSVNPEPLILNPKPLSKGLGGRWETPIP